MKNPLESFLLHRSPKRGTEYLIFFLGKAYIETSIYYMFTIYKINNGLHLDPNFSMKQFASKK